MSDAAVPKAKSKAKAEPKARKSRKAEPDQAKPDPAPEQKPEPEPEKPEPAADAEARDPTGVSAALAEDALAPLPTPLEPSSDGPTSVVNVEATGVPLTRYERTHVIGIRAEQLARGALAFVEVPSDTERSFSLYEIAERELAAGKLPFIVVRHMPDNSTKNLRLCPN